MGAGIGRLQAAKTIEQAPPFIRGQAIARLDRGSACARGRAQQVRTGMVLTEKVALGHLIQQRQHHIRRFALGVQMTHTGHLKTIAAEGLQFYAQFPKHLQVRFEQGHLRRRHFKHHRHGQLLHRVFVTFEFAEQRIVVQPFMECMLVDNQQAFPLGHKQVRVEHL